LYIDENLTAESPVAFGLHPNAEIAVKNTQADTLFKCILDLQPRDAASAGTATPQEQVKEVCKEIKDKAKDLNFKLEDIRSAIGEAPDPFQNVFLQEADRVNILTSEIMRALDELLLGLAGELQMSQRMEDLMNALFFGRVPMSWANLAYPSLRSLDMWVKDLEDRHAQVKAWEEAPNDIPKVVNLALFFNPQSFLTAVMQKYSQATHSELDKLVIQTIVTRKTAEQTDAPARSGGAFVTGFFLEGAKWNWTSMVLEESAPREMFYAMPVIACHAVLIERLDKVGVYMCPVYKTQQRGPTFVFFATLKTKMSPQKWVLGGVVMVLEADL